MGMNSLKHRIWSLVYPNSPIVQDDVFRQQFLEAMTRENLKRLWVIGLGLLFTESVVFWMPGEVFDYKPLILVYLPMQVVLTLALTGIKQRLEHFSYAFLNFFQLAHFVLYIFLAMGLSLLSQGTLDMVHVFIAGLVSLVISLYIPFFTLSFLLLASLGSFLALLPFSSRIPTSLVCSQATPPSSSSLPGSSRLRPTVPVWRTTG